MLINIYRLYLRDSETETIIPTFLSSCTLYLRRKLGKPRMSSDINRRLDSQNTMAVTTVVPKKERCKLRKYHYAVICLSSLFPIEQTGWVIFCFTNREGLNILQFNVSVSQTAWQQKSLWHTKVKLKTFCSIKYRLQATLSSHCNGLMEHIRARSSCALI